MTDRNHEPSDDYSWLEAPLTGWKSLVFWAIVAVVALGLLVTLFNLPIISGNVPA